MSSYRLHIDIPVPLPEDEALRVAEEIRSCLRSDALLDRLRQIGVDQINYRLGHDEDRQRSNYFIKNENGHVANKKSRISVQGDLTTVE